MQWKIGNHFGVRGSFTLLKSQMIRPVIYFNGMLASILLSPSFRTIIDYAFQINSFKIKIRRNSMTFDFALSPDKLI
jgi:hypothetical protein